jgi:hypothetical protein
MRSLHEWRGQHEDLGPQPATARSSSIGGHAGRHYYGLRVRARDNAGNVSSYSAELRIWVP